MEIKTEADMEKAAEIICNTLGLSLIHICPQSAAVIYHFSYCCPTAQRTKKVQESNAKIPAQKMLVTYYLPTLALSKSGSGLKHPLTLSPPVRAPLFHYPYHFVMVCFITALLYTPVFKRQAFCSVLF